jgi:L-lactate dehydrogenase complex protein LldG
MTSLVSQFESTFTAVGGKFHRVSSLAAATEKICSVAQGVAAKSVIAWDTDFLRGAGFEQALSPLGIHLDFARKEATSGEARQALREKTVEADIGLTQADFVLADTGTMVLLAKSGQPRSVSLVPPRHIAILRPEDFVADLDELFARISAQGGKLGDRLTSAMTFITGPSRTADIEQTLFIGVHGPLEVHAILLEGE